MVSAPKAPDPKETAEAQAGMNRDTATTQQLLNMVNQVGPDGSLTYTKGGTTSFVGADGKTVNLPRFTATTRLSPTQAAIKAETDAASLNLGGIAKDQSAFLKDYLGKPIDLNNETVEARLYDLGSKRLDPRFAQEEEGLRTRLANQGVQEGSAAWNSAFSNFGQGKNDAYNSLLLNGRQQAVQEALTERNQPLNEIIGLLSGSQVQAPQFVNTPTTGVGGVDYTGLVNNKYQADVAQHNSTMGGLFGLLSAPFSMFSMSDRRAKTDIRRVGTLDNGLPVYAYRYKGEQAVQIGLMADEVELLHPKAVATGGDGFKRVRYDLAVEAA